MNPLINTQHNPFADVPAQIQETETYSYSGIGIFMVLVFFCGILLGIGVLIIKGWNLKVSEEVFLILWLSVLGFSFLNWPKTLRCDTESLAVTYWVRPSQRLQYEHITSVNVRFARGWSTTVYRGEKKPFCIFEMNGIRDSKKLVKTIVERANLTFQQGNDHTGEALFVRLP